MCVQFLELLENRSDCISRHSSLLWQWCRWRQRHKLNILQEKWPATPFKREWIETFHVRTNNKWPSSSTTALKKKYLNSFDGKKCEHNFIFNFILDHSFRLHFRSFCARNILLLLLPLYVNVCVLILYHSLALCQPNCYYFDHLTFPYT